jgi:hypothetical protein
VRLFSRPFVEISQSEGLMPKLIAASLAAAALFGVLSSVAYAAPATPGVPGTDDGTAGALPKIGSSKVTAPPGPAPDQSGIDRTFRPDYSQALTVQQMTVAWTVEIDRVFQTPITGGG